MEYTRYQGIKETTAELEWADLITIDLSKFDEPGGKAKLAAQLKHAISTVGFFYVTNFGLSEEEVDEQFALAKAIFDLPAEEKQKYRVDPTKQGFFGWKPRGSRKQQHGLVDNLELYDDPKWNDVYKYTPRPPPLVEAHEKAEQFQRHLAFVLKRLLILSAIIMELDDEEALWKLHDYESQSQCHLRYMLYHPRTPEELVKMQEHDIKHNVYGHTDFGSFTLLMRQPVAALQVRPYGETKWKWVKPLKGSITVNVADTLSFLTGGYLESSIHRVVLPPEDQRNVPRYGVIYFSGPDDTTLLKPVQSPLLERGRVKENQNNNRSMPPDGVTAGEWVKVRFGSIDVNYANNKDNKVVVKSVEVVSYA
ncbi:Clavaminate synthase-like protein [Rhizodiscina lignyota]|uniref:Clavaminate synthase-like protein n=1 Tax=Rhizodiscina lignyota TaxID=1504668 RepID=A0A9P4IJ26_9PEZI|nr:Clavaminate synthase-like protein [Rhizodiscina lignyota]